jgi:hypothetical protein
VRADEVASYYDGTDVSYAQAHTALLVVWLWARNWREHQACPWFFFSRLTHVPVRPNAAIS